MIRGPSWRRQDLLWEKKKYERSSEVIGRFEKEMLFIRVKRRGIVGDKDGEKHTVVRA